MKQLLYLLVALVGIGLWQACAADKAAESVASSSATTEPAKVPYYREDFRPVYHFTPESGWMNDPNGLVFLDGVYHMYYQFYPDSNVWGPMHWGHATSRNLVNWTHQEIALFPDEKGYIFSGSIVFDRNNSSGLGTQERPALVAFYTYHDPEGEKANRNDFQSQAMAFSNDGGYTWTKFDANPIIPNPGLRDFRDPKVVWHEASKQWVMVLAAGDHLKFYTSKDLKSWDFSSDFGKGIAPAEGIYECPDLFSIRNEDTRQTEEVLILSKGSNGPNGGTATAYMTGRFDGKSFIASDRAGNLKWLDEGSDNYAFVTFDNAPVPANRRLGIGWMSNWRYAQVVPTYTWRSAMTIPRVLTLHKTADGTLLRQTPVPDLFKLRGMRSEFNRLSDLIATDMSTNVVPMLQGGTDFTIQVDSLGRVPDFEFTVASSGGDTLRFGFDAKAQEYFIDRSGVKSAAEWHAPFAAGDEALKGRLSAKRKDGIPAQPIRILWDRSSLELFGDGGFSVLTATHFLKGAPSSILLDGDAPLKGTIYQLQEALPTPLSAAKALSQQ